ncbi:unnamed protein product [Acanthoscelides obtectus]|uniref:Uncharacterized protein n=1 Tax=Acanthoscelides obtectus TaxID=200917 RepID=A0A9P0M5U6_ACAOB|nr:unnamed protein product [Acanthoscelides obtectus]CAK1621632.1 hypothetical protein AOBTE_LOCUS1051 [Acanthoscelides obtectus]
MYINLVFFLVI